MDAEGINHRQRLVLEIAEAVRDQIGDNLSDDEQRWVRLAIKKQEQQIKFREAIITKTLSGVVWMLIVAFGYLILDYARNHGFKP